MHYNMSNNQCPATSKTHNNICKMYNYFYEETQFRRPCLTPSWISQNAQKCRTGTRWNLKEQGFPFRKYQIIYYTPPCHVFLSVFQTNKGDQQKHCLANYQEMAFICIYYLFCGSILHNRSWNQLSLKCLIRLTCLCWVNA